MKKQYLISLLGLAAISISLGNGFSSMTSSASNTVTEESTNTSASLSEDELDTIEAYENEFPDYSIEQISMGYNHSAAVINDGKNDHLYTWGSNFDGQLGLGDKYEENYSYFPQEVTYFNSMGDIEQISMGLKHSAAVVNDGTPEGDTLYTWGKNDYGELGLGKGSNYEVNTPTEVTGLPEGDIEQIEMGDFSSSAIISGDLYTWGINSYGQLGLGTGGEQSDYENAPQEVTYFNSKGDIEQISTGENHSAVILNDDNGGHLYTWGKNNDGQLGLSDDANYLTGEDGNEYMNTPQEVTYFNNQGDIEQISMGVSHSAAVMDNELYTWGNNHEGQLGLGIIDGEDQNYPLKVELLDGDIEQISMGDDHSTAVVNDGTSDHLYTWGRNEEGQLGLGTIEESYNTPQEVQLLPKGDIEQISAGGEDTGIILKSQNDTSIYTWGENRLGQLGIGGDDYSVENYYIPQEMWTTPYIYSDSFYSSATISDDLDEVVIQYGFETNLEAKNVTILLQNNNNPEGIIIPKITKNGRISDRTEQDKYIGELTIDNLVPGADYTYTIELNYKNYLDDLVSIEIDQGEFSNNVVPLSPEFEETNVQNNQATSVEIAFDLDLGHDQGNVPYTLDEIIINDNYHKQEWTYTDNGRGNNVKGKFEINSQGEGYVEVKDLYPNTSYTWDVTFLLSSPWEEDNYEFNQELDPFETKPANTKSEISSTKKAKVNSPTEATIDYNIEPGTNVYGEDVTISKVEWIDNKKETIALSTSNKSQDILIADALSPNTTYANTFIVAEMSDGSVTNIETIKKFETGADPSKVEASTITSNEFNLVSPTEANIGYSIELGKDEQGNEVTPTKVEWMNGKETLDLLVTEEPSGTLTATNLSPNAIYANTFLVAEMSDGTTTNICEVAQFETETGAEDSKITSGGIATVNSSTEATIDYNVEPGKDADGNPLSVAEVKWMNGGKELATSTLASGVLTTEALSPNVTYGSTTLVAKMSDGSETKAIKVESFDAEEGSIASAIKVDGDVKVYGPTEAKVDYDVNLGLDVWGNPVTVTKVSWMNGDDVLDWSTANFGVLEADNLVGGTTYDETTLVADMSDGTTATVLVGEFETTYPDLKTPEIECIDVEVTDTSATFDYVILEEGMDANGDPYILSNIVIKDQDENVYDNEHIPDGNNTTGSVTVTGLTADTSYEGWTMEAIFTDNATGGEETIIVDIDTFTTINAINNGLGTWAIVGITAATILLIAIIAGGLTYFIKRYKA